MRCQLTRTYARPRRRLQRSQAADMVDIGMGNQYAHNFCRLTFQLFKQVEYELLLPRHTCIYQGQAIFIYT